MLLPALKVPLVAIGLPFLIAAVWLAWKSVAYPLALSGIPSLLDAIVGSDPLPKGGVTFLLGAWIGLAVMFTIMRGESATAARALRRAPVILSLWLLGLMLLRLGASAGEPYGSMKVQLYIADDLLFMLGAVFVGSRKSDLRLFLLLMLGITSAGALLLLDQLLSGSARATVGERFSLSAQEYPIQLARSSADGLMIAIYMILAARKASLRLWAVAMVPVLVVSMLAAGSRGPVLAFFFGLIFLIALTAAGGRARRRLLQVAGGMLVAALIVPIVIPGSAAGRALSTILGGSQGLSSNGRSHLWSLALTAFSQHPLLGIGTGGFATLSTELYPHNILLEAAAELGLLGAIVVVGIIVSSLRRLIEAWRTAPGLEKLDAVVLIALFLSALGNALFSGAIQNNQEVWIWAGLGLGMSTRLATSAVKVTPRRSGRALAWGLAGGPLLGGLAGPRHNRTRAFRAR